MRAVAHHGTGPGDQVREGDPHPAATAAPSRRSGYVASILVNLILLYLVNHLLDWRWPPFLTGAFSDLLPIVTASFWATIAVNAVWVWRDPAWFRHLAQIGLNGVGVIVMVRTWQIFPFDLAGPWDTLARAVLVLGLVGIAIATVVELVRLSRPTDER